MLRQRPKSIAIIIAIMCSLFGMISGSNAFEIVEFPSDTEDYSYGGITYHTASLKTDVPFYSVWWYVDGTFVSSTYGGHEKTEASFSPHWLTGGIKGVKYTIKAEAMWIEDDGTTQNDTDSYTVRMFESKIISDTKYPRGIPENKRSTGVYGFAQLTRHYHDGRYIVVEGYVYARNRTKQSLNASSFFRQTEFRKNERGVLIATGWSKQDPEFDQNVPIPTTPIGPGESYYNSGSSAISYDVEGDIGDDQRIYLNAHVHLDVSGAVWHENGHAWTHEFTAEDNQ